MSQRSFGSEIGNTEIRRTMTASNSSADVSLVKHTTPTKGAAAAAAQMEKNGSTSVLRLPKPLAVEVYTKLHNSTLSKEDLLEEIEDLVDEKFYIGETLLNSAGREFVVASIEKKGGLTIYTMEDGTKIGHRDLKRQKGLSVEEIKQIAIDDVEMHDKVWKVKEALLKECPIRETKKFAPIFSSANRRASAGVAAAATSSSSNTVTKKDAESESDSDVEEIREDEGRSDEEKQNGVTPMRRGRASGGPATTASRRLLDKKKEKERLDKERMERKEREKEEKLRKKEEEKAKKQQEKEEKLKKKEEKQAEKRNGTMDKFVKKENGSSSSSAAAADGNASLFSPLKWAEKRTAIGVKKVDDAWKKRDLEAFNDACQWCEKNLSGPQRNSIENETFKFAIQKMVDKTKDRANMKGMKWAKKAEYKAEMAEKRKDVYRKFEPIIKTWFSEDVALDDLLVTADSLDLSTHSKRMDCDEELLKCMEIAQYFVSMRKILLWNENISAEQLKKDLHNGLDGFKRSTYKMIANLLETALQEKEHEKAAHCNARLSEFPITEHTITELVRAFFIGNDQMSYKRDSNRSGAAGAGEEEEEDEEEPDEMDSEERVEEEPEPSRIEQKEPEEDFDQESTEDDNDEGEAQKVRILALFSDPTHIYEWPATAQIELLYALKEIVHELPIIREWYLKDANTEQLNGLRKQANVIAKKIEQAQQQLADLPTGEITDDMTRNQTREMEKVTRKRQQLEKTLDELKDEMEENREETARERDDLERIFRVVSIGNDRHLRKYYWFAYSRDAGIWVQDFGTTSYEKWVRDCYSKGFMDVETLNVENRPEYEDLPLTSSQATEVWYKIDTESSVRHLVDNLKKNGKREKALKKYISNNMDDILSSIRTSKNADQIKKPKSKKRSDDVEEEEQEQEEEKTNGRHVESEDEAENGKEEEDDVAPAASENRFSAGPFASLKLTMMELLADWQLSGITRMGDAQQFESKLKEANGLEEMKPLVIELASSIPQSCLIEKFPQPVAIAKKCFSHLKMYRFRNRVNEAINSSCLHLLLAYFDARIDQQKTITELLCQVCRRKQGTRKLMCKQCDAVYHIQCHRPTISRDLYEEDGFKEGWWCAKCTKEDRRRQLAEAKEKREQLEQKDSDGGGGGSDTEHEDDEDIMEEEESRGRSAKRKANAAMRDVLEFEGVLRHTPAPPPPKRAKKSVAPEVQELFNSIEKANPRLYKVLQLIPSQTRSTRNSHHETRSLPEIEDDLDVYPTADQLRAHLTQFFQQARGYVETHNPRKLDELESLISELNFV